MAYIFSDGFDGHGALADRWDTVDANISIDSDTGKYGAGTNSLFFNAVTFSSTCEVTFPRSATNPVGSALNPLHFSFFFKTITGAAISDYTFIHFLSSADSDGFGVRLLDSGLIRVGTLQSNLAQTTNLLYVSTPSSTAIADGNWHHIEIKQAIDNSSGITKVWIDGVLEVDFSGDTLSNGTLTLNGFDTVVLAGAATDDWYFDDLLIWDEEGSSMNTSGQLGVHRIETLIPNGDGNSTQLTPTGAGTTNADRVDEVDADDDTTYVESSTATHKDLYTYTNMSGTPATINGVVVHTRGTNPDNGAISFKTKIRSNVTEGDGATFQLPASGVYAQHADFIALDPDGSVAWDKTNVDAAEFGVEVV